LQNAGGKGVPSHFRLLLGFMPCAE